MLLWRRPPTSVLVAIALALATLVTGPTVVRADGGATDSDISRRVTTHLQRGIEFYAEKEYELAIVEFRAGFAIDPRPEFLFALAQAERLSGDCPTAVIYYQRFLRTNPDPNQAEAARVNMKRCTRALESGPEGRPPQSTPTALARAEDTTAAPAAVLAPTARVNSDRGSRWYRDSVTLSLIAASAIGVGLGTGFWVAKGSAETAALTADRYDEYVVHIERARRDRTIAVVGFGAGAALAGVAVYRYLSHSREARPRATPVATGAGGAVTVGITGWF